MPHLLCKITCSKAGLTTMGGRSAASFCHQGAAWVPDILSTFNLVKIYKIAKNSTTTKAREKNKHRFWEL